MGNETPRPDPPYRMELMINAPDRETAIAGIRTLLDEMELPESIRLDAEHPDFGKQPGRAFGSGPGIKGGKRCYGYHIETYRRDVTPEQFERESDEWFQSQKKGRNS